MRVVGIIPARWQSSRFPGKPLAEILGKSLIQRTYENALESQLLDEVAIATDDARIFEHAKGFGAPVFMTSSSCPSGTDRTFETIETHFQEAQIIVNIQGDEPCLDPLVIDTLIETLSSRPEAALTTPVSKIVDPSGVANPSLVKCVFDKQGRALYFSRSAIPFTQQKHHTPSYYRHIGVYCFRREALKNYVLLHPTPLQESEDLEQLKMLEHGLPIHVCIVEDQTAGVDTPEDLKKVEALLCHKENISSSQAELSLR